MKHLMKNGEIIPFLLFLLISAACNTSSHDQKQANKPGKRDMEAVNRYLVQKEREVIQNYIERKGLKMTESPTGFWYMVEKQGDGDYLKDNDRISMNYECYLLDGTFCYSSSESGPKEIILGRTEIEPGMNEGLKLLKRGAQAIFIIPPFLAYGLVGDGKKIPPETTIVYNVSIK
jgi:FKBP-type peptidyl-prolyl cis-trans isomerase